MLNPDVKGDSCRRTLTVAVFGVGLQEEVADPVWWYGEGDPRCDFHGVDANHLAILQEKIN